MLKNRKLIVTGGPTREWLDPVRFISNPSSGKMGISLAEAGTNRFRETVFIHGPIDKTLLEGKDFRCVAIETAEDMLAAVLSELEEKSVLIMAAAPADYRARDVSDVKIKKAGDEINIILKKNPDILKTITARREQGEFSGMFAVGFAVETHDVEAYAISKLRDKKLDMICLNDVSKEGAGFAVDTNIIIIYEKDEIAQPLPMLSKIKAAEIIIDRIESRLI